MRGPDLRLLCQPSAAEAVSLIKSPKQKKRRAGEKRLYDDKKELRFLLPETKAPSWPIGLAGELN